MSKEKTFESKEVDLLLEKLLKDAAESGYKINPDMDETRELVEGLVVNQKRYGYLACPCRLASGKKDEDLDIICPCDYRDPDLDEYGACYCNLYVYDRTPEMKAGPVPERRPTAGEKKQAVAKDVVQERSLPIWLCKVCGYLCARENPPAKCPVCKVGRERFRIFMG
jgi:ferredoxin-thioredoxin reductase catalytic subunit